MRFKAPSSFFHERLNPIVLERFSRKNLPKFHRPLKTRRHDWMPRVRPFRVLDTLKPCCVLKVTPRKGCQPALKPPVLDSLKRRRFETIAWLSSILFLVTILSLMARIVCARSILYFLQFDGMVHPRDRIPWRHLYVY